MNADDVRRFGERAAEVTEALWPGSVEIDGTGYDVALGNPPVEGSMMPGGEVLSGDLIVRIRKDLLPEPPARETRMQARGRTWVIRRVTGHGADACWTLNCEPHN